MTVAANNNNNTRRKWNWSFSGGLFGFMVYGLFNICALGTMGILVLPVGQMIGEGIGTNNPIVLAGGAQLCFIPLMIIATIVQLVRKQASFTIGLWLGFFGLQLCGLMFLLVL